MSMGQSISIRKMAVNNKLRFFRGNHDAESGLPRIASQNDVPENSQATHIAMFVGLRFLEIWVTYELRVNMVLHKKW